MAEKLSVTIELLGGKEIEQELEAIGKTGTKAFNDIQKAADKAGGFGKLDPTALAQQLGKMGISGEKEIDRITAAVQRAGRLETLAAGVRGVENAFSKLGAAATGSVEQIGTAVEKVGAKLTRSLGPLGVLLRGLGPVGIAIGAPTAATVGLLKFANAAEETEKALRQLQATSAISFSNLSALANVFEQGGTKVATFASEFGNLSEKIQAAGQARLARQADQEWVQWANDIDSVRQKFDNLGAGGRATFSALTTLQTKVQAVLESLSKIRDPQEQWLRLAEIFRNLGSDMERVQLGKALGLSPETIQTLTLGSAKLQQMAQQAKQLGLVLDDLDKSKLADLRQSQTQAGALFDALRDKMGALAAPAFTSFFQGLTAELQRLAPAFQQLAQQFGQLDFSKIGAAAADFLLTLGKIAVGWADLLSGKISFADVLKAAGQEAIVIAGQIGVAIGEGIIGGIISVIQARIGAVWEAIKSAFGFGGAGGEPSGFPPQSAVNGMAAGGLIGGRGTGTSDTNLAWVSRGEHIMPARAVAQPGVLALLEALRRSGGNLSRVLDGMGRFALGGLVSRPIPAFAGGGLAGGMSNVTIQFPGLPDIGGLRASASAVDELRRAAALAQVRSGGRKPSRYS